MAKDEIKDMIDKFVNTAKLAAATNFDGIELHAAHMYLFNQFLSPISNHRDDEYGGSTENRFRFLKETMEGIRAACPRPFIISVRLPMVDLIPGGITLEEGAQFAKMCQAAGADMIDVSMGFYTKMYEGAETQWEPQGARVYMAEAAKKAVTIPVAAVGKIREPEYCADLIENETVDLVAIGRPLICDPQWPNKILFGKQEQIRTCLNCLEGCMNRFVLDSSIRCAINPYVGYEDMYSENSVNKTGTPKKLVVVGGGIAGMQFAIIAKKRGHDVTIVEKTDKMGGQMMLASVPPHKEYLAAALDWFRSEVKRNAIPVMYNTVATPDSIAEMNPDAVILAVGAEPNTPPIKGIEKTVDAWNLLKSDSKPEGKSVVVIGGGIVGAEVAHLVAERDCTVTVLEMAPEICNGHDMFHKDKLTTYLNENTCVKVNARVEEISEGKVTYIDEEGKRDYVIADMVISATGQHSIGSDLYDSLIANQFETYKIGDCHNPTRLRIATREAFDLAYHI